MAERTVFQSISRKHVTSLGPQASVRDAACVMTRANCGSVLIMEPPDILLGILTERDLMTRVLARGLDPERTTAREVMTPNPICVPPETPVSDAVGLMLERWATSSRRSPGVRLRPTGKPRAAGSSRARRSFR